MEEQFLTVSMFSARNPTENVYESKFTPESKLTPESDGKSSPEFLALLSQIKSGIGQKSTIS